MRASRRWIAGVGAAACGLAIVVKSCGAQGTPPPHLTSQAGWTVTAARPALSAGSLRAQALWNDPSVLRTSDGYVMYMTSSVDAPFKPPIVPFRAISADGVNWRLSPSTPLLRPVTPYASVETPSVVRFGGRWHMFFTGIYTRPAPAPMAIGHAISDDGVTWHIDQPVLIKSTGRPTDWNSYLVAEPGAVVVAGTLRVYFSAVGARRGAGPPQEQSIGMVATRDGRTYSAPRRVLTQSRQFSAARGYAGYSSPAAIMIGRNLHLFYSVAHFQKGADPEWRQVAIAEAISSGGDAPFVEVPRPALTIGSTQWSSGEVIGPSPLLEGNRLWLWFGGHVRNAALGPLIQRGFSGPEFGIGRAMRADASGVAASSAARTTGE